MHEPFQSYRTLAEVCTKLEIEHGLQRVNHQARRTQSEGRATDMEQHSGIESLVSWVRRECLEELCGAQSWRALHQVMAMTDVLHINPLDPHWHSGGADTAAHQALDTLVRAQLEERRAARAAKDWSRADAIRDTLAEAGIVVEDSAEGVSWSLS